MDTERELENVLSDFGLTRRQLLRAAFAMGLVAGLPPWAPAYARPLVGPAARVRGASPGPIAMDIAIRAESVEIAGGVGAGITLNGTIPGPLVELYEGHEAVLRVHNHLDVWSSIHWHGILLPFEMDGVPGVTFPGIPPGETFEARFPVRQRGTYWYHSHSGLQEQSGVYGPLVVHPAEPDPFAYDRDYVVVLSDWTFEDPHRVLAKLKKMNDYYNFQQRTVVDLARDIREAGWGATLSDRLAWGMMRMSPTDIADVSGYGYHYLLNGLHPAGNWTGIFAPGERVRLRVINASAMSFFNVRIPDLPMTVVAADGPNVAPVEVDEFQIGVAETYDVIVEPGDRAYTLFAESMDRSGYARGTLAPREGMVAPVPALRERPIRTMIDMGMDMEATGGMKMPGMGESGQGAAEGMDMKGMEMGGDMAGMDMAGMDHGGHGAPAGSPAEPSHPGHLGSGMEAAGPAVAKHGPDTHGAGNLSVASVQRDRLGEPGTGLKGVGHRVLVYSDLRSTTPQPNADRPPDREVELHLTGNMERYMWSFDGVKFSEVESPIELRYGERIRLVLVNDTMMEHPIHLHGMFMELDTGAGAYRPLKHTISVKPAERVALVVDANEPGRWAFHCHLLYHMEMGMFRVVRVSDPAEVA